MMKYKDFHVTEPFKLRENRHYTIKRYVLVSNNAVRYTFRQLLSIAFPNSESIPIRLKITHDFFTFKISRLTIRMPRFSVEKLKEFIQLKSPYAMMSNVSGTADIPVFSPDGLPILKEIKCVQSEGYLEIPYDFITPSFVLLACLEEFFPHQVDEHGRLKFEGSVSEKYNLIEIPLVDEYAFWLRKWITLFFPDVFEFKKRTPSLIPTHDIDILYRYHSFVQAFRSCFGRDWLINKSWKMAMKSWKEYRQVVKGKIQDPYISAIYDLLEKEIKAGCRPVFFFKALTKGEPDATYDVKDARVAYLMSSVFNKGGTLGVHGSYDSAFDPSRLTEEKSRLVRARLHNTMFFTNGRQHYLRAHFSGANNSLFSWHRAQITHDYSVGFAQHSGFRSGTCHPYRIYDVYHDRESKVIEHPLIVMDGTLFDYMKLSVEDARTLTQRLKQRCFDVEGDFVVLWHNHATTREFEEYYREVYLPLVSS